MTVLTNLSSSAAHSRRGRPTCDQKTAVRPRGLFPFNGERLVNEPQCARGNPLRISAAITIFENLIPISVWSKRHLCPLPYPPRYVISANTTISRAISTANRTFKTQRTVLTLFQKVNSSRLLCLIKQHTRSPRKSIGTDELKTRSLFQRYKAVEKAERGFKQIGVRNKRAVVETSSKCEMFK